MPFLLMLLLGGGAAAWSLSKKREGAAQIPTGAPLANTIAGSRSVLKDYAERLGFTKLENPTIIPQTMRWAEAAELERRRLNVEALFVAPPEAQATALLVYAPPINGQFFDIYVKAS